MVATEFWRLFMVSRIFAAQFCYSYYYFFKDRK